MGCLSFYFSLSCFIKVFMSKVLIGIVVVLLGITYYLFTQNQTLTANNLQLEGAIATQEEAIQSLQDDFSLQTSELNNLAKKNQAAERELNRYVKFIQNYQLTSKILEDPVEMERKINNGTKHIMEDIEKISTTVDDLDDGLQLQPASN
jgi:hypothetical protein